MAEPSTSSRISSAAAGCRRGHRALSTSTTPRAATSSRATPLSTRARRRRRRGARPPRPSRLERDAAGRARPRDVPLQGSCSRSTSRSSRASSRPSTARRSTSRAAACGAASSASRSPAAAPSHADGLRPRERRAGHRLRRSCASRSACSRRSRRSTSRRWCRSGSCRSRSRAATRSSSSRREQVPLSQQRIFELLAEAATCRRASSTSSTAARRSSRRSASTRASGRVVRRLDAGRAARLPARDARRQARAGARRREELHRRDARRRLDRSDPDHRRVVLRLRGRALPGRQRAGRRSATRTAEARDRLVAAATALKVGDGLEPGVDMGPVISARASRARARLHRDGRRRGRASSSLDGRATARLTGPTGYFVGPTVFDDVTPGDGDRPRGDLRAGRDGAAPVKDLDEAFAADGRASERQRDVDLHASGKAAREFAHRATASMVGVNIGVAAPMAYFPFGGAQRQLLRRPEGARPRRVRLLHRQEGRRSRAGSESRDAPSLRLR